jgi:hypothetical protein
MQNRGVAILMFPLALVVAFAGGAQALEGSNPVPEGKQRPYAVVRAEMLKLGWKPFKATHFDYDSYCADDICKRYPELLDCSCCGVMTCTFGFFKSSPRHYRLVVTQGEEPNRWKVVGAHKPDKYDMDYFRGRPGEPSIKGAKKL